MFGAFVLSKKKENEKNRPGTSFGGHRASHEGLFYSLCFFGNEPDASCLLSGVLFSVVVVRHSEFRPC